MDLIRRLRRTVSLPLWHWGVSWETYPFRIIWVGFWTINYDRSGKWYEEWPHMRVTVNRD